MRSIITVSAALMLVSTAAFADDAATPPAPPHVTPEQVAASAAPLPTDINERIITITFGELKKLIDAQVAMQVQQMRSQDMQAPIMAKINAQIAPKAPAAASTPAGSAPPK